MLIKLGRSLRKLQEKFLRINGVIFDKMKGLALVVGAGGIGTQIAKDLSESEKDLDVVLCGRKSEFNSFWELDIEDPQSLLQLKNKISNPVSYTHLTLPTMIRV